VSCRTVHSYYIMKLAHAATGVGGSHNPRQPNFYVSLDTSRRDGRLRVLEVLNKHIQTASDACSVGYWLSTLAVDEQKAFESIKENSKNINISSLYAELNLNEDLPFKLTAFRSHLRSYCTCPKN